MSDVTSPHFYARPEAEQLVGLVYQLVYPFFGVPDGTRGKVVGIDQIAPVLGSGYELIVEWDLAQLEQDRPRRDQPLPKRTWFSRAEMERYMQRVEKGRLPTIRKRRAGRGNTGSTPPAQD